MSRAWTLCVFMIRDLFRSLGGAVPPLLTLGLFQVTFLYGGKVDYFASVGGADIMFICLITTLLLASRANRAVSYLLLARLERRVELLGAIAAAAILISVAMGVLLVGTILGLNKVTVTPFEMLVIVPR